MSDDSGRTAITDGYVVPIAGLLALVFALMTGITAGRALSGDPADIALPVIFGLASLVAVRVRQRSLAARDEG
ncbi:hypothetical protein [Halorubrum sp. DTA46]|uniref:hypothetical protein n=1 Tax=Halorubrum sp. DTA46 TaxID=3402162 RepID=UPI003AB08A50